MKKNNIQKLFSSLFIFALIFSLLTPAFSATPEQDNFKSIDVDKQLEQMQEVIDKHESLLEREPSINPSLLRERSSDAEVDVIIQFTEAPVALEKGKSTIQQKSFSAVEENTVKDRVQSQQEEFEQFLKKNNIPFEKGASYDHVLNGVSGKVNKSDLEELLEIPGILRIDPDYEVYALETPKASDQEMTPFMDQTVPHLGIDKLHERGITGEGVKVAVLDTGIDYNHPDLEGIYKGGLNFVDHDPALYKDERDEDDAYETSPGERPEGVPEFDSDGRSFYTTHGTHVAGTIAAQGNNEYNIKGIAPDIDLYAYRVLGAYGSGSSSGIIDAIDKAVEEEMDIINLSLGGGSNSEESPDSIAINNAVLAGVTAVVATGNAGPGRGTIGNPATAALAISVGNSTPPEEFKTANVSIEAGDLEINSQMSLMAWTYGSDPAIDLDGELEVIAIPGYGETDDFADIDVEGKIALISRGETPFVDKIAAAKEAGAIGALIHNNVETGPADVYLSTAFDFIPAFDMPTEDGEALRGALEEHQATISFSNFVSTESEGNEMSLSSSQGPSIPNFDIKPDVVAPGSNIMSTVPAYQKDFPEANYGKAYDRASGTSMATPHAAAVAALVKSAYPDFDPFDIKVAMSNTAELLDTDVYDVFEQGAGLVQAEKAIDSDAYAYVTDTAPSDSGIIDHKKGTITFGHVEPHADESFTITKEIELKNNTSESSIYDVSVDITKNATGNLSDATVTVDKNEILLNETETITVTLTIPSGEPDPGNELLGYIHITNGNTNLSLPFAAEFGPVPVQEEYFYLTDYAIAPNSEGSPSTSTAIFNILENRIILSVELHDANNVGDGSEGLSYMGAYALQPLPAGAYQLEFDHTYMDTNENIEKVAPDGVYGINLFSLTESYEELNELEAPFFIKSTNPEISFDSIDSQEFIDTISGTIDDQFVDFKEAVEQNIGVPYNVNEHLDVTYEITKDGEVAEEGETLLQDDGSFDISVADKGFGDYTITLSVVDELGHTAEESFDFSRGMQPIEVTLAPSTTEQTDGPLQINVEVDSKSEVTTIKWLQGEHDEESFAENGEEMNIDELSFSVQENSIYTVFAENISGATDIETITVTNINHLDASDFEITSEVDNMDPTVEPVSITIYTNSESDLVSLQWLPGIHHDIAAFNEDANNIDLDTQSFSVESNGGYTVFAVNDDEQMAIHYIEITNIIEHPDVFEMNLTPSTTEETEGPVTIGVSHNSEVAITEAKWLPGKKSVEDFEDAGNAINLSEMNFDVMKNGEYTVYLKNEQGITNVQTISIFNIVHTPAPEPIKVSYELSKTDLTVDPITITILADTKAELTDAKWMKGKGSLEEIKANGNGLNLADMSFEVTTNGTYSVYLQNSDGTEVLSSVTITNIINEEPDMPENPGEPGTPGEPANPKPCIPCDDEDVEEDGTTGDDDDGNKDGKKENEVANGGNNGEDGASLPSTATNTFNYILLGSILTIIGGISLYAVYRRKRSVPIK